MEVSINQDSFTDALLWAKKIVRDHRRGEVDVKRLAVLVHFAEVGYLEEYKEVVNEDT